MSFPKQMEHKFRLTYHLYSWNQGSNIYEGISVITEYKQKQYSFSHIEYHTMVCSKSIFISWFKIEKNVCMKKKNQSLK